MPQDNVKVALEVVDAANRRDADAFVACLSPDVEWEENGDVPGARVIYRGRAEVRGWFEDVLMEPWDSKVARRQVFWTRDEALEAVGLAE